MKKDGAVYYLYGDQLGSVSAVADGSGASTSKTLYHPWGTTRHTQGASPTDYAFTGQMQVDNIYYYNARWYDPMLGRFMEADTIVPSHQGTQGFDRYAYVNNNPMRYTDPTGHWFRDTNLMMHDSGGGSDRRKTAINYDVKSAISFATSEVPTGFVDTEDYYKRSLGLGTCGDSLCTIFVSRVITEGGRWTPRWKSNGQVALFEYGCPRKDNGELNRPLPYIYAPDFVEFMSQIKGVTVSEPIPRSHFSPDLFQPGDIVAINQEIYADYFYNHIVFVTDVLHNTVNITELSGKTQALETRNFLETNVPIKFFIVIRISEVLP